MSGNLYTHGDVASAPGEQAKSGRPPETNGFRRRLGAYWLSNPGKVILIATVLALAIRLFTLSRPGSLTGITEYDDGVYLGGSIRLTEGHLPYLNFAFVQPPGILELMAPVALPPHSEVLLASGPLDAAGALPPNTAAWLAGLQLPSRYNA